MISSIFGKTKPINYIIVLSFVFAFYWLTHLLFFQKSYGLNSLLLQILVLSFLLFSFFVVNFIVKRNQITGTNAFTILYYALLLIIFPETLTDNNAVLCSFFLLLSQRRLISLRSLKDIKLKVFDATLWIGVASLFYDWAILFLVLVFVAIYFYEPKNIKNWFVPFIALFVVAALSLAFLILTDNLEFFGNHYRFSFLVDADFFNNWGNSGKIIAYALVIIFVGLFSFLKLGKLGLGRIITMRLIAVSLVLGLLLTILKTSSTDFPILVTFFPASVLLTKYIEVIKKINLKEIALIVSIILPFIILAVDLIMK